MHGAKETQDKGYRTMFPCIALVSQLFSKGPGGSQDVERVGAWTTDSLILASVRKAPFFVVVRVFMYICDRLDLRISFLPDSLVRGHRVI